MSLVAGDLLFVPNFCSDLQIFRLGDSMLPPLLGAAPTLGPAVTLAIDGDRAYLPTTAEDRGQLAIYDVASPVAPAFLAATDALPYARAIAVAAGTAYVGAYAGVQVIDVSDPASPVPRGTLALPGGAIAIALGPAGILFAVSYGEHNSTFYTVSIADAAAPAILGSLLLTLPGEGIAYGLARAYVYGYWGLQVVDPSRPDAPKLVSQSSIWLTDFELVLPEAGGRLDPLAYLLGYGDLSVADLSDPDTPVVVRSVLAPPPATTLALAGRHLYAGGGPYWPGGFAVYDLLVPDHPAFIGGTAADLNGGAIAVHPGTGHVHVAGRQGLRVLPRQCEVPGPVAMTVHASGIPGGIEIAWSPGGGSDLVALRIRRSRVPSSGYETLTPDWLPAGGPGTFIDRNVEPGITYFYLLEALDRAGAVSTFGPVSAAAGAPPLALAPPRPNPSRPLDRIEIGFALPRRGIVHLDVIDAAGRCVRRLVAGELDPGSHVVRWDGTNNQSQPVATGSYFLRLDAGARVVTRRLVRLR